MMNTAHRKAVSRALRASEGRAAIRRLLGMEKEGGTPRILYPVVAAVVNALGLSTTSRFRLEKTEKLMAEALLSDLTDWDFDAYGIEGLVEQGAEPRITKAVSSEGETEVSYQDSPHAYGFSWGAGPMVSDTVTLSFDDPTEITYNWTAEKSFVEIAKYGSLKEAIMKLGRAGAFMPLGSEDGTPPPNFRFSGVSYLVVAKTLKDYGRVFVPLIKSTFRKELKELDKILDTREVEDADDLTDLLHDHDWNTSPSAPIEEMTVESVNFTSTLRTVTVGNSIKVDVLSIADNLEIELEFGEPDGSDYDEPDYDEPDY